MFQLLERRVPGSAMRLRAIHSRYFHASASLQRLAVTPRCAALRRDLRRVCGEPILPRRVWSEAYTFALVRNPWARQVSMFHFLLQTASCKGAVGARQPHCELRKLPAAGAWLQNHDEAAARFRKWLADMRAAFPPGSRDQHLFGARSHGNEADSWYNASQLSWFVDARGTQLVNDVFKLEELETHWPTLRRRICGLSRVSYSDGGLRRNPSSHVHYSRYYDDESRRTVAEYMAVDLDRFGYRFEAEPAQ